MNNSSIFSSEVHARYELKPRHAVIFLILAAATCVGLEAVTRGMIQKKASNFQTIRDLKRFQDKIEVLLLGDSHFEKMIGKDSGYENPDKRVFDLSTSGSNFILSYYLFKKYSGDIPKLRAIVLPVDLHSFNSFRRNRIISPHFWDRYVDHEEVTALGGGAFHRKNPFRLNFLKEETGRTHLLEKLTKGWIHLSSDPAADPFTPEATRERVNFQFSGKSTVDPLLLLYFEKTLKLAKERGLQVITIQTPVSRAYVEQAAAFLTFEELFGKTIDREPLKSLIDCNLNYADLFWDHPEYFEYDGDHLNKEGSKALAKILIPRLLGEK